MSKVKVLQGDQERYLRSGSRWVWQQGWPGKGASEKEKGSVAAAFDIFRVVEGQSIRTYES